MVVPSWPWSKHRELLALALQVSEVSMLDVRGIVESAGRALDQARLEMRFRSVSLLVGVAFVAGAAGIAKHSGAWDAIHDAIVVPFGGSPRSHRPAPAANPVEVFQAPSLKDFSFPEGGTREPMEDIKTNELDR